MATIVKNPDDLPEYNGPQIPGLKPPIQTPLHGDDGDPAEVDTFLELLREIHGKPPKADR
jgi:hypothetical protein